MKFCSLLWRSLARPLAGSPYLPIQKVEPFTATLNGAGVQHQSGIAGRLMAQEKRVSRPFHRWAVYIRRASERCNTFQKHP